MKKTRLQKSHATGPTHPWWSMSCIHQTTLRANSPLMVDELNSLVGPVMSHAVVHHNVEAVPLAPHVDEQGHGVSHVHGTGYPGP